MTETNRIINLNITFKHTEATDALKQYAQDKIEACLKKFVHHDTEAHLILRVEKNRQIAEISFRTDGADFNCKEEKADLYIAIDSLVDALTHQLRKHKEKITSHH